MSSFITEHKIGDWTEAQLIRFIQDVLRNDPVPLAAVASADEMIVGRKLTVNDEVLFNGTAQSTVGAAGGASALPATPAGYIRILDNQGAVKVIPYYNP